MALPIVDGLRLHTDPREESSRFQTHDGSTPAGDGDPLGRIENLVADHSHAVQPTAGNRPVLEEDAQGRIWEKYSGSHALLNGANIDGLTLSPGESDEWTMVMVCDWTSTDGTLFSKQTGATNGMDATTQSNNRIRLLFGGNFSSNFTQAQAILDRPTVYVLRWDGSELTWWADLYDMLLPSLSDLTGQDAAELAWGARQQGTDRHLTGRFGTRAIYDRALTLGEVRALVHHLRREWFRDGPVTPKAPAEIPGLQLHGNQRDPGATWQDTDRTVQAAPDDDVAHLDNAGDDASAELEQSTSSARPTLREQGEVRHLEFNNDLLRTGVHQLGNTDLHAVATDEFTIAFVLRAVRGTTDGRLFTKATGSGGRNVDLMWGSSTSNRFGRRFRGSSISDVDGLIGDHCIHVLSWDGSTLRHWVNGVALPNGPVGSGGNTTNEITVGARSDDFDRLSGGDLSEPMVWDVAISEADREALEEWALETYLPGDEPAPPPNAVRLSSLGLEFVHMPDPSLGDLRLSSLGVEYVWQSTPPNQPTHEAIPGHGALTIITSQFDSELGEEDEHLGTRYQVALTSDPGFNSPVENFELTFGSGLTSTVIDTLAGETTYLTRVRHRGVDGVSFWSPVVEATTLEEVPFPDKPDLFLVEKSLDYFIVQTSPFSHPEGTTTEEDYDPDTNALPYLLDVRFQVQPVGGDWGEDLIFDSGDMPTPSTELQLFMDELDPDTSFEVRARHLDGHYGLDSPWSDILVVTTDPIPPVRPGKPTISMTLCGPQEQDGAAVESGDFTPPEEDPTATHTHSQWRACTADEEEVFECESEITSDPAELLEFSWPRIPAGSWRFYVRHRDSEGRWSEWSEPALCQIAPAAGQPEWIHPTSGQTLTSTTQFEWAPPVGDADGSWEFESWEFEIEESADDGVTWTTLLDWSTQTTLVWQIGGKEDGLYTFRLRARDSEHESPGPWIYLTVHLDRTGTRHWSVHARDLVELPQHWKRLWHGHDEDPDKDQQHWRLVDRFLADRTPFDPETDPAFAIHSRTTSVWKQVRAVLAIPELGEPKTGTFTIEFAIVGLECHWWMWRWAHTRWMQAGIAVRAIGGIGAPPMNGYMAGVNSGGQPWPIPGKPCNPRPFSPRKCLCECVTNSLCCAAPANLFHQRKEWPRLISYATAINRAHVHQRHISPLMTGSHAIPNPGPMTHGLKVTVGLTGGDCIPIHTLYQMRMTVDKPDPEGAPDTYRIRSKITGPGLDPSVPYHHERISSNINECGAVGFALYHYEGGLGNQRGVLFRSFSATDLEYEDCEEPEEPPIPPPFEPLEAPCIVDRRYFLGLRGSSSPRFYLNEPTDDEHPIVAWARTREIAPFGIRVEGAYTDVYFNLSAWTTGLVHLTPVVDGERRVDCRRTIEFTSDGFTEFTKRYELALYEPIMDGEEEIGRRALRGTFFRLEVEVIDLIGTGRVNVGGFEVHVSPVVKTHPDQVYTVEEALRRELHGTSRSFMLGLAESTGELLAYGASEQDAGEDIPLLARSVPAAPAGPGGEVTFRQVSIPIYRYNKVPVTLNVTPIVDGVAYPIIPIELAPTGQPVRETHHLDIYRPVIVDGEEVGRNAIRGAWWTMDIRGDAGVADGTIRVGQAELEVEPVTETEEPL